eukprot:c11714_g1_i1.p1 GENE.c11714_g1_i1~~c11714_g1_i1.p1  ORF type:complete len:218 (+),score=61.37 c11714_g1_i1:429-1082(+)
MDTLTEMLQTTEGTHKWTKGKIGSDPNQHLTHLKVVYFQSVHEYLFLLQAAACALKPAGNRAIVLLAAAVSDFYIPESQMHTDKIQSSTSGLQLNLHNVPKVLSLLTKTWAPNALVISFKLETNQNILIAKAAQALIKYGVDCVVANVLGQHQQRVTLVTCKGKREDVKVLKEVVGDEKEEVVVVGVGKQTVECDVNLNQEIECALVDALLALRKHT